MEVNSLFSQSGDAELVNEFGEVGIVISDNDILDKLKEICVSYRLTSSSIANEWAAYSQNNHVIDISVDGLGGFETSIALKHKKSQKTLTTPQHVKQTKKNRREFGIEQDSDINSTTDDDTDLLLSAYSTPAIKSKLKRLHTTPENRVVKRTSAGMSPLPVLPFSPASFSPAQTPSHKYKSRLNSGDVLTKFGSVADSQWLEEVANSPCTIVHYNSKNALQIPFQYMFQKLLDKALILNDVMLDISSQIQSTHNLESFSPLALPIQDKCTFAGRVCCDSNGRLNSQSVLLEGDIDMCAGRNVQLDLSEISNKSFSLFPGQVIVVEGTCPSGKVLRAENIYQGIAKPFAAIAVTDNTTDLHVTVASGPFTTQDNLSFDPMNDLINHIKTVNPHVCVMTGPFIDVKNEVILKCQADISYDELFQLHITQLLRATESSQTQFVIVPSCRDVHHDPVYPQPPFPMNLPAELAKNVHLMSDPCLLNINGVITAITSTDILFSLGSEEISVGSAKDRLSRLVQHIITQQSFYPLWPPAEDVCIEYEQFYDYARLPVTPHILITPSDLKCFVKDIDGCLCLNPGRVTKGFVGGTFAQMIVKLPHISDTGTGGLTAHTAARVIRI